MNKNILVCAFLAVAGASQAISFNYVSVPTLNSASINFSGTANGGTFGFQAADNGYDFVITHSSNASLVGLRGNFRGVFAIGPITTVGPVQGAPVLTSGTLSIFDGASSFTADLAWNSIFSLGTTVGLNADEIPNVTNAAYTGTNSGLIEIFNQTQRTITLSTQFIPSRNLAALTANGAFNKNSYSGTFNAVPEPATMAALALGLAAVARRRKAR